MQKYIEIHNLEEALDGEIIVAAHSESSGTNYVFTKAEERAHTALKEARSGACRLLVWREVGKSAAFPNIRKHDRKGVPSAGFAEKWIPVKKGLPLKKGKYLCTCRWDESVDFRVDVLEYGTPVNEFWVGSDRIFPNGYAFGEDWGRNGENDIDNIEEVIAWMPLPNVYIPRENS